MLQLYQLTSSMKVHTYHPPAKGRVEQHGAGSQQRGYGLAYLERQESECGRIVHKTPKHRIPIRYVHKNATHFHSSRPPL